MENHGLRLNPFSGVKGFTNKEPKKEMSFWTQEEFEKFINCVDDIVYKNFFLTIYLTGCRKGEVIALNWNDIDFNKKILKITKTYSRKIEKDEKDTTKPNYKLTSPKTATSNRGVLLPDILINYLKDYKEHCAKVEGFSDNWFIFGGITPLSEITIDRQKNKFCKLAKVKQIRMQDFRHSHASLMINNNQNILIVAQRLGHSDIKQTLNTYSHLFPNQQEQLLTSLNINLKQDKT
jgi:integrase